jgi:hypothetical protein
MHVWKDLCEGIKCQHHQTPTEFRVIRFRDTSLINKVLHPLTPGTVLVFEDTCSIEYVDATSARKIWGGNSGGNFRWDHTILRWNGKCLTWVSPSTVSSQSAKRHWDTVNCHTPQEIVQSIISGFISKPSRSQRDGVKRQRVKSPLQDVERLQRMVGELQASINTKEATISNLQKQLEEVTAENCALRSSQVTSATPPSSIPSVSIQRLPLETTSVFPGTPTLDHCLRRLPSSLIPPVRRSFYT